MLHFRSRSEAEKAEISEAVRKVVLDRIDQFEAQLAETGSVWDAERDGHFSVLSLEEAGRPLEGMGWETRLAEMQFESVVYHPAADLWDVVYVPGNNWGWVCFFPHSRDLPEDLRAVLFREIIPQ